MKDLKNVSVKPGTFYLKSREPKEGYEEITYPDRRQQPNPDGTVPQLKTYHRLINSISGTLTKVALYNDSWGQHVKLFLDDGEFVNALDLPLKNRFGSLDGFIMSVIKVMGNLELGSEYSLFVNNTKKTKNGKLYQTIIFKDSDNKPVRWSMTEHEVPKLEIEEDPTGNKTYNGKKRDNYLLEEFMRHLTRFEGAWAVAEPEVANKEETHEEEYNDELPF